MGLHARDCSEHVVPAGMPAAQLSGAESVPPRKSTIPDWLRADVARLASLTPSSEVFVSLPLI